MRVILMYYTYKEGKLSKWSRAAELNKLKGCQDRHSHINFTFSNKANDTPHKTSQHISSICKYKYIAKIKLKYEYK